MTLIDNWEQAIHEYRWVMQQTPPCQTPIEELRDSHLIYVSLRGPWFYINGEKNLSFKTRGDNEKDLREALIQYNIDFWESDFDLVAREMADQLYAQAISKQRYEVFLKRGVTA